MNTLEITKIGISVEAETSICMGKYIGIFKTFFRKVVKEQRMNSDVMTLEEDRPRQTLQTLAQTKKWKLMS
jgi:hypothetical protein